MSGHLRAQVPLGALALLVVLTLVQVLAHALGAPGTPTTATAAAQEADPPRAAELELVEQSSWVGATGTFELVLATDAPVRGSTVGVTIHDRLASRLEFEATLAGELGEVNTTLPAEPLVAITDGGDADRTEFRVVITLGNAEDPEVDDRAVSLSEAGVYPLVVDVATAAETDDGGTVVADPVVTHRLVTHLVRVPDDLSETPPLAVATLVDIHEPLVLDQDQVQADPTARAVTAGLANALQALPQIPATIRPTPAVVDQLVGQGEPDATRIAEDLRLAVRSPNRQVLATPYARLDMTAWLAAGLEAQLNDHIVTGKDALVTHLEARPDNRTVVHDGRIPRSMLDELRGLGVDQLIVDEADLSSLDTERYPIELLRPFELADSARGVTVGFAVEEGLADRLGQDDPVLAAHQALADLAVLFFDLPSQQRGLVAKPPTDELFDPTTLRLLLIHLRDNPIFEPTTVDALFQRVPLARQSSFELSGEVLQRQLVTTSRSNLGTYPADLAAARVQLDAYTAMVGAGGPRPAAFERRLLLSSGEELTDDSRGALLASVTTDIRTQTRGIDLPERQSVTLTSSEGKVPVNIRNTLDFPVRVLLTVESDKLDFPEGTASQVIQLDQGTNRIDLDVEARTTGDSQMLVRVSSPDGVIDLGEGRYTIRSTSVSGVGIAISIGAGLVLAIWWLRHHRSRRRDKRLVDRATHDYPALAEV